MRLDKKSLKEIKKILNINNKKLMIEKKIDQKIQSKSFSKNESLSKDKIQVIWLVNY